MSPAAKAMAHIYRAMWSWRVYVIIAVIVSYMTKRKPLSELKGLVYGVSPLPEEHDDFSYEMPIVWAGGVAVVFVILNVTFW